MPVWAALMITSSLPTLFTPVRARSEWLQKINMDSNERVLRLFFQDEEAQQEGATLVSGNLLASMPLEFLTNNKCNKLYFQRGNYTFINFALNKKKTLPPDNLLFKRQFFGFFDMVSLGFSSIFGSSKSTSFDIPAFQNKLNVLQTYIESHDNLILDLYYLDLLKMPIHLSTLDFDKIKPMLANTVEQA